MFGIIGTVPRRMPTLTCRNHPAIDAGFTAFPNGFSGFRETMRKMMGTIPIEGRRPQQTILRRVAMLVFLRVFKGGRVRLCEYLNGGTIALATSHNHQTSWNAGSTAFHKGFGGFGETIQNIMETIRNMGRCPCREHCVSKMALRVPRRPR